MRRRRLDGSLVGADPIAHDPSRSGSGAEMIVGTFSSQLLLPDDEPCPASGPITDGLSALRQWVAERAPTVILAVVTDHAFNRAPKMRAPFFVGVADQYAWADGECHIAHDGGGTVAGNRALAESLVDHAIENRFDLGKVEEWRPAAATVPIGRAIFDRAEIALVPLLLHPMLVPARPISRFVGLGRLLGGFLERNFQDDARILVYGAGLLPATGKPFDGASPGIVEELLGRMELAAAGGRQATVETVCADHGAVTPILVTWLVARAIGGATSPRTLIDVTCRDTGGSLRAVAFEAVA